MKDLSLIPDAELEDDRNKSVADIHLCAITIRYGVRAHGDGLRVLDRIRRNCDVIERIEAEQVRRRAIEAEACANQGRESVPVYFAKEARS